MNAARQSQSHQPPLMSVNKAEGTPSAPLFPIYQVLDTFRAFCHGEPAVKAQHRSLFYFLIEKVRQRGALGRFLLPRDEGIDGSRISKDLYGKALRDLHAWGFIHYTEGANRFTTPIIEVFPDDSRVQNIGAYRVAYQVSALDSTPSPSGSNKRLLDKGTLGPTESEAALALAQKKIAELEAKISQLEGQASASHTGGGATDVATSVAEARVIPLAIEDDPYGAQPRDVEMVNEFIANHHDPEVRKHAGKGHLFWAEYAPKGWVYGRFHTPIKNWRHLIPQFQFREPTSFDHANASSKHRPASGRPAAQASRSGSAKQPIAEGHHAGPALTGTIDDL